MKTKRKSAKDVCENLANDLLRRPASPDVKAQLLALETIAYRMNWFKLYDRLRFRERPQQQPWWLD